MVSKEEYISKVEEEYMKEIKSINLILLEQNSWKRGQKLHYYLKVLENEYVKYYIFNKWWSDIDYWHNLFKPTPIKRWLKYSDIDIKNEIINSNIDIDKDGYIKVYRGHHNLNQGWDGLSWTTNKETAIAFANGKGIRFKSTNPELLTGKVKVKNILGIFNERNEDELVCTKVIKVEEDTKIINERM